MLDDERPTDLEPNTATPTADVSASRTWDLEDPDGSQSKTWDREAAGTERTRSLAIQTGRYRVTKTIGKGGMGEVIAALDTQIGREVAIKRIHGKPSAAMMSRFLREARIQGRLEHPAIVPVHELSYDDNANPFFVMKRLSGITLAEILRGDDPELHARFPRERLLRALSDVCLAVEFAHQRGVIHRDLKPANIMLGDFGEVYVLDWGIARVVETGDELDIEPIAPLRASDSTLAGAVLGTPGYMAPEQARGDADLDARADVFALGAILFEILAGRPMLGATVASVFEAFDPRPSRVSGATNVPPELDEVCLNATTPDRTVRIASARELHERVQRFLDGDRDLALRRRLAKDHIDEAFVAFARRDDESARRIAMQAAGRAIALDPTATEAATLVTRLMLEPPAVIPREVFGEVERLDEIETRNLLKLSIGASLAYLLFLPILWWIGMRSNGYLALFGAAILVNTAVVGYGLWRNEYRWTLALSVVSNALVIALVSHLLSPFLVAPGIAVITTMSLSYHPWLGRRPLWAAFSLGVLGPWVLELAGVFDRTLAISDGSLVVTAPALVLRLPHAEIGLAIYAFVIVMLAHLLGRAIARNQYDLRCRLQVQTWQLRQLVPT
jgi:eukaryotic-like serine/threonine-protein kinase